MKSLSFEPLHEQRQLVECLARRGYMHAQISRRILDPDGNPVSPGMLRHIFANELDAGKYLAAADQAQGDASFETRGALWRTIFALSTSLHGKLPQCEQDRGAPSETGDGTPRV
jgi:hypothetical protein